MMNRITRLLAVTSVSGALALGAAGVAQASPDHGAQKSPDKVSKVDHSAQSKDRSSSKDRKSSRDRSSKDGSRDHGKKHERSSRR